MANWSFAVVALSIPAPVIGTPQAAAATASITVYAFITGHVPENAVNPERCSYEARAPATASVGIAEVLYNLDVSASVTAKQLNNGDTSTVYQDADHSDAIIGPRSISVDSSTRTGFIAVGQQIDADAAARAASLQDQAQDANHDHDTCDPVQWANELLACLFPKAEQPLGVTDCL